MERPCVVNIVVGLMAIFLPLMTFGVNYVPYEGKDFIVRSSFQDLCDHIYDPWTKDWTHPTQPNGVNFDPNMVKLGDVVFARNIEKFFTELHPKITVPYIILTHGEFHDTCMEHHISFLDDDKIIAWFSIHPPKLGHRKFFPIPIGICQKEGKNTSLPQLFESCSRLRKTGLAYMNWSNSQNSERLFVTKLFENSPDFYFRKSFIPFEEYLREMAQYKFALSPRGWGPDCYRTWEALLVGTIPIVRRGQFDAYMVRNGDIVDTDLSVTLSSPQGSQLDKLYEDLPILIIDEWEELTSDFLNRKYEEITSKTYTMDKLFVSYWKAKIEEVRNDFMKGHQGHE